MKEKKDNKRKKAEKRMSFAGNFVKRFSDLAMKACPEKIRGDSETMRQKLSVRYEAERLDQAVEKYQRRNAMIYTVLVCGTLVLASVISILSLTEKDISGVSRPQHGEGQETIPVTVQATRGETEVKESGSIVVLEEELSDAEKEAILEEYAAKLPDLIAKEENGVRVVTENFSLPDEDDTYGISVTWESSDPVLISDDGTYDVTALASDQETVKLTASLSYEGMEREVSFDVVLRADESLYRESISKKVQEVIHEISAGAEGSSVKLPDKVGDISLKWKEYSEGGSVWVILLAGILFLFVFFRRYAFAEHEIRKYREGIVRNFPAFIDKLVLLLNSGLTVLAAMEKMAEDSRIQAEYDKNNMLAYETARIGRNVNETNASVVKEWRGLAARTGIHEIMRFSTIIEDNINKGTALAEKLEIEGDLLRESEKKKIQERIRMIDSRLTLPMILMLFSLVLVTVAPAMMQM